ncbi:Panacea domain-containing protein [Nitrosomonas sp. Is37]|uniref:Panacea domain-containing protein n=1 Tax=Nitrosomonas sp. Is37 TaxID=3080535 RepID=UPI00294B61D1|nr:Panacea domain-containing protein [Nitrosomonas sp. Is37]MDV6345244.1 Panacea domain-containing protein [Nitrosomonas sp. Is37]
MTISVFDAAKTLGYYAGWRLSNLQMQKILYLAHMVYMGENKGEPLVDEEFQSWDYGPVLPSLYYKVKFFGNKPVQDVFHRNRILTDGPESKILKDAAEKFSNANPGSLIAWTHRPNGAWDKTYIPGARNITIPNKEILAEYQSF